MIPEDDVIQMMVEEIVLASFNILDILGENADKSIRDASHSAVKQLLAIKAYSVVTATEDLKIDLQTFYDACK